MIYSQLSRSFTARGSVSGGSVYIFPTPPIQVAHTCNYSNPTTSPQHHLPKHHTIHHAPSRAPPMHRPMHGPTCPSTKTQITWLATYRYQLYRILLLHTSKNVLQGGFIDPLQNALQYCNKMNFN